jgi:hypothetical protein
MVAHHKMNHHLCRTIDPLLLEQVFLVKELWLLSRLKII